MAGPVGNPLAGDWASPAPPTSLTRAFRRGQRLRASQLNAILAAIQQTLERLDRLEGLAARACAPHPLRHHGERLLTGVVTAVSTGQATPGQPGQEGLDADSVRYEVLVPGRGFTLTNVTPANRPYAPGSGMRIIPAAVGDVAVVFSVPEGQVDAGSPPLRRSVWLVERLALEACPELPAPGGSPA